MMNSNGCLHVAYHLLFQLLLIDDNLAFSDSMCPHSPIIYALPTLMGPPSIGAYALQLVWNMCTELCDLYITSGKFRSIFASCRLVHLHLLIQQSQFPPSPCLIPPKKFLLAFNLTVPRHYVYIFIIFFSRLRLHMNICPFACKVHRKHFQYQTSVMILGWDREEMPTSWTVVGSAAPPEARRKTKEGR